MKILLTTLLTTLLFCAGCASFTPDPGEPGTLRFMQEQQWKELAAGCYAELTRDPFMKTYYNVGGVLVDERSYCRIRARLAVQAMSLTR